MSHLQSHLYALSQQQHIPQNHINFLSKLKHEMNFTPKVVYDIGACVGHWTKAASKVWCDAEYVLFDAFMPAEFLYKPYKYHIGVLSSSDNNVVKFYENPYLPTGNSYYREIGCAGGAHFPENRFKYMNTLTLDTVVSKNKFPLPDLVKIDVQGSEVDIIKGGMNTIQKARYLIVELQHTQYNQGAPKANVSKPFIENLGWQCIAEKFQDNGPDADYCFENLKWSSNEP